MEDLFAGLSMTRNQNESENSFAVTQQQSQQDQQQEQNQQQQQSQQDQQQEQNQQQQQSQQDQQQSQQDQQQSQQDQQQKQQMVNETSPIQPISNHDVFSVFSELSSGVENAPLPQLDTSNMLDTIHSSNQTQNTVHSPTVEHTTDASSTMNETTLHAHDILDSNLDIWSDMGFTESRPSPVAGELHQKIQRQRARELNLIKSANIDTSDTIQLAKTSAPLYPPNVIAKTQDLPFSATSPNVIETNFISIRNAGTDLTLVWNELEQRRRFSTDFKQDIHYRAANQSASNGIKLLNWYLQHDHPILINDFANSGLIGVPRYFCIPLRCDVGQNTIMNNICSIGIESSQFTVGYSSGRSIVMLQRIQVPQSLFQTYQTQTTTRQTNTIHIGTTDFTSKSPKLNRNGTSWNSGKTESYVEYIVSLSCLIGIDSKGKRNLYIMALRYVPNHSARMIQELPVVYKDENGNCMDTKSKTEQQQQQSTPVPTAEENDVSDLFLESSDRISNTCSLMIQQTTKIQSSARNAETTQHQSIPSSWFQLRVSLQQAIIDNTTIVNQEPLSTEIWHEFKIFQIDHLQDELSYLVCRLCTALRSNIINILLDGEWQDALHNSNKLYSVYPQQYLGQTDDNTPDRETKFQTFRKQFIPHRDYLHHLYEMARDYTFIDILQQVNTMEKTTRLHEKRAEQFYAFMKESYQQNSLLLRPINDAIRNVKSLSSFTLTYEVPPIENTNAIIQDAKACELDEGNGNQFELWLSHVFNNSLLPSECYKYSTISNVDESVQCIDELQQKTAHSGRELHRVPSAIALRDLFHIEDEAVLCSMPITLANKPGRLIATPYSLCLYSKLLGFTSQMHIRWDSIAQIKLIQAGGLLGSSESISIEFVEALPHGSKSDRAEAVISDPRKAERYLQRSILPKFKQEKLLKSLSSASITLAILKSSFSLSTGQTACFASFSFLLQQRIACPEQTVMLPQVIDPRSIPRTSSQDETNIQLEQSAIPHTNTSRFVHAENNSASPLEETIFSLFDDEPKSSSSTAVESVSDILDTFTEATSENTIHNFAASTTADAIPAAATSEFDDLMSV